MYLKRLLRSIDTALTLLRLQLIYWFRGISGLSNAIRLVPAPIPALRKWGAKVGARTLIYPGVTIHAATDDYSNLVVGEDVRIVRDCLLDLTDRITIGDQAIVSMRCSLITHRNIHKSPLKDTGYSAMHAPITIGRGAVLFVNVTVLAGVTIGECAMVAAGAVVTENVLPWTLVAGVPARVIKSLR